MSPVVESLGVFGPGRQVYFTSAPRFVDWPDELASVPPRFIALVVADARGVSADEIGDFANKLLEQGAAYVCTSGGDCERVHDVFDEELVGWDGLGERFVLTTWHANETLEDALWFALWVAIPHDEDITPTTSVLIAMIGTDASAEAAVREWIASGARANSDPECTN